MGKMNADHDFDLSIPDPQATVLSGPARVGAELRAVREHLGWKLPDIAARLKIRQTFIEAIEAGNLSALPAPAYAAGFIRSYAEAMGLDPDEILRRFRAEGLSRPRQPRLAFPEPLPDRAVPPGAVLFLVAVIAVGGYFLWYRHSEHELKLARMVPAVPAKLAPLAVPPSPPASAPAAATQPAAAAQPDVARSGPTQPTPAQSPPAQSSPVPSATTQPTTAQSGTATAERPAPTAIAPTAPIPDSSTPAAVASASGTDASTTAGTTTTGTTAASGTSTPTPPPANKAASATPAAPLVISATATSWVQVKGAKGTILFSRVLKPGQSWPVPDEPGLTLTTGNAGGTVLVRNGVAGQPLGRDGSVMHGIVLTPPASGAAPAGASGQ